MKESKVIIKLSIIFGFIISLFAPLFLLKSGYISIINPQKVYILPLFSSVFIFSSFLFNLANKEFCKYLSLGLSSVSLFTLLISRYLIHDVISYGPGMIFLLFVNIFSLLISLREIFDLNQWTVNDIVEIGVYVSLAIILDMPFCKIRITNTGGSISFSMLPLIFLSLRKGFIKGFISCGVIFGLITCLLDGYGFITYPLDYLLAFGSLAFIGFGNKIFNLKNKKFCHYLLLICFFFISIILRTLFATLSGILIYQLDFVSSLVYQLTYILPSSLLVFVALIILYKPFSILNNKL